jgi:hypothetical protein
VIFQDFMKELVTAAQVELDSLAVGLVQSFYQGTETEEVEAQRQQDATQGDNGVNLENIFSVTLNHEPPSRHLKH